MERESLMRGGLYASAALVGAVTFNELKELIVDVMYPDKYGFNYSYGYELLIDTFLKPVVVIAGALSGLGLVNLGFRYGRKRDMNLVDRVED